MALRSQTSRQGIRWRYAAKPGGRRRGRWGRWPWALLSILIIAGVGLAVWNGTITGNDPQIVPGEPLPGGGEVVEADYTLPAPDAPMPAPRASEQARPTPAPDNVWMLDGTTAQNDAPHISLPAAQSSQASASQPAGNRADAASPATTPDAAATHEPARQSSQTSASSSVGQDDVATGFSLIEQGRRVEGRKLLSRLLVEGKLTPAQAQKVRDVLTVVNHTLIYGPAITPGDPLVATHVVKRGDRLVNIAIQYKIPHQFIEKINRIDANRIQIGQKIKVLNGPFHAVVTKTVYRMDIYLADPHDGQMIYIRSFNVGLGADDSTPLGQWVVRPRSKVVNPAWTNPRTGETFSADDPKNPIGEFWMGLEGVSAETASLSGYGIHGTIEPDSIGTQSSMGCVRLRDEDIAQVFHMLWEGETTVSILK